MVMMPASSFSSKWSAASSQTGSGTQSPVSAWRAQDSARARAARSASVKNGASRQAETVARRSSLSPAFLAVWKPDRTQGRSR